MAAPKTYILIFLSLPILLLSSCGFTTGMPGLELASSKMPAKKFLSSGTVVISRAAPEISTPFSSKVKLPQMLGYLPPSKNFLAALNESWLRIDRESGEMDLMIGDIGVFRSSIETNLDLKPGVYSLRGKSKDPCWYAPNRYFEERNLDVPAPFSRARFLRGALGDTAIYTSFGQTIHSSPVYSSDVGGIRVPTQAISKIFNNLKNDARIVVE